MSILFIHHGFVLSFVMFYFFLSSRRMPSFLEYYGYIFHHSMLLVGPVCSYKEYIDFIEGHDIRQAMIKVRG